jgi:hypothetical protein
VIFNKLHRRKLDANREIVEAADGNPAAEVAWNEFHMFTETAKNQILPKFGKGFYLDLHGHAHSVQRLEIGYLLSQSELALSDPTLDAAAYIDQSSIRRLASQNALGLTHSALLHGPHSLGSMLAGRGYPATPSQEDPFPDPGEDYFNGGYNTARYSSLSGGALDGLQIECNRQGIRDSIHNVLRFADSLSVTLLEYLGLHYYGDAAQALCPNDLIAPEPPASVQFEIFPNPYCVNFFVQRTAQSSPGNWVCEVYDFYGKILKMSTLEEGEAYEVMPRKKENMFVVIRKDGVIIALQAVMRFCR